MTQLKAELIAPEDSFGPFLPEWLGVFTASGSPNPLLHPLWLRAWASHFVATDDLRVVAVRAGDQLVAVAPFYRKSFPGIGLRGTSSLQLLGGGRGGELSDLPGIVTLRHLHRQAVRAVLEYLDENSREWGWIDLTLTPDQGWLEPQWLPSRSEGRTSIIHKATRPCVVVDLPSTWEEFLGSRKRNVRESLRRGRNRLRRLGAMTSLVVPQRREELDEAMETLVRLHRMRGQHRGSIRHSDFFSDRREVAFLRAALSDLFEDRALLPFVLKVDGKPAAARLLFRTGETVYFLASGFDPDLWDLSVATTLMGECFRWAIDQNCRRVNLSTGVDQSKLRWSERLELHQEFIVVGGRVSSRAAFGLYWQLRAGSLLWRDRRTQQVVGKREGRPLRMRTSPL